MMITTKRAVALMMAGALVLTACGDAPDDESVAADDTAETTDEGTGDEEAADDEATEEEPPAEPVDFQGCLVTDTGGIDDRSFNQTAWEGLERAEADFGIDIANLESNSESDYEPHLNTFVEQGCGLIVTVGFLLEEATAAAAEDNPDQNFAIIDAAPEADGSLLGMVFATDEAAFLAGYAAADTTETGIVGTWGGLPIPPVTIFMDGFLAGVEYYNQEKGADVEVLGWDGEDGVFTNDFDAQDLGANVSSDLLQNGADIIMPVAGPAGLGTATAIDSFGSGKMIWVDTDGYESTTFGSIILTSVEKRMDNAVYDAVDAALDGTFEGGVYTGTLENDGVGISPFHDFEDEVSDGLQAELDEIREGIIAGDITVEVGDHA